ncbi:DUF1015 domain-containing protein [Jatrophihabitans sp.]|uniref:DUF1015 domain-containing protein n=1 Tax=Jatrophihabitans sp. TaxID=1932789 RepID=UPI0030C69E42|nr:hypothetical protein [Jatrophihabitans sp.]
MTADSNDLSPGLVLSAFRALRPASNGAELAALLCPPYDVISPGERAALLAGDPDNAVAVVLPQEHDGLDRYQAAAALLESWADSGRYVVDEHESLYVYEMRTAEGATTRGLLGAVELRDPADGVILPHENTMAGPVSDRLALMSATEANVEPIYLVYDGGGAASAAVRSVDGEAPLASATTPDGTTHTLWAIDDPAVLEGCAADLASRRALIADGHHRYATYRQLQEQLRAECGPGPWDYGLTLLVDSSSYGPQVHAIHRAVVGLPFAEARDAARTWGLAVEPVTDPAAAIAAAEGVDGFLVVITDGTESARITDPSGALRTASELPGEPAALAGLDVTMLHRGLVEQVWGRPDTVESLTYAHSIPEVLAAAAEAAGTAVLLRPTPVAAVAAVAAAGARMPRKSTLFTPKPASGLVMRRFADAGEPAAS